MKRGCGTVLKRKGSRSGLDIKRYRRLGSTITARFSGIPVQFGSPLQVPSTDGATGAGGTLTEPEVVHIFERLGFWSFGDTLPSGTLSPGSSGGKPGLLIRSGSVVVLSEPALRAAWSELHSEPPSADASDRQGQSVTPKANVLTIATLTSLFRRNLTDIGVPIIMLPAAPRSSFAECGDFKGRLPNCD